MTGYGFDRNAEYSAWLRQSKLHYGLARWAAATELHAEHSVTWTTQHFPEHKAVLLPRRLLRLGDDSWGLPQILASGRPEAGSTFKNLIVAADGPKPELMLANAVSTIKITANARYCLVYDRPLGDAGLSWADLVAGGCGRTRLRGAGHRGAGPRLAHCLLGRAVGRGDEGDRHGPAEAGDIGRHAARRGLGVVRTLHTLCTRSRSDSISQVSDLGPER
jgi:hypothetical protein